MNPLTTSRAFRDRILFKSSVLLLNTSFAVIISLSFRPVGRLDLYSGRKNVSLFLIELISLLIAAIHSAASGEAIVCLKVIFLMLFGS